MLARQSALLARRAPMKLVHARGVHIENTVHNVRFAYPLPCLFYGMHWDFIPIKRIIQQSSRCLFPH